MLDDRKVKVLYAIINSYLVSAEPIGSRTISKEYDLGVSPATIRNEMSDLEDEGFLTKPHSSAGRVPSDKAYRLYVNELLRVKEPSIEEEKNEGVRKSLYENSDKVEDIIRNSTKILSNITSYTALAMTPQIDKLKLKHIQLMNVGDNRVLMVMLNSSGVVNNSLFTISREFEDAELLLLSNYLNEKFINCTIDEIIDKIKEEKILEINIIGSILKDILPYIKKSLEDLSQIDIYLDGVSKILEFPEYKDLEKAKNFINFVENEEIILDIFKGLDSDKDVNIVIGSENNYEAIKDCSLITTNYNLSNKTMGKIGIIGPTRMDYVYLINVLDNFSRNISEVLTMLLK